MEDAVAFYVKINDHPYLIRCFYVYKTMIPTADIDFSNIGVFLIQSLFQFKRLIYVFQDSRYFFPLKRISNLVS